MSIITFARNKITPFQTDLKQFGGKTKSFEEFPFLNLKQNKTQKSGAEKFIEYTHDRLFDCQRLNAEQFGLLWYDGFRVSKWIHLLNIIIDLINRNSV